MITIQHGQQPDEQLMLAYQAGQQKAFDELYQRYRQPIFAYLMRNIGSQVQAEEVYQEVWLSLIKQRSRYTASASFRSYIFYSTSTFS
jgi:RNA polymerase sigma-70 factor (ECF subfamily)